MMNIIIKPTKPSVSKGLHRALIEHIDKATLIEACTSITCNFRDSTYSAESGGYHPVEICIQQNGEHWDLLYISDFAYCGGPYPELAVEVDFNFEFSSFQMMHLAPQSILGADVRDFYKIWEANFLCYLSTGAFDQIKVTAS